MNADKAYLEAASLIAGYLKQGQVVNRHALCWHAGQMYAMAHEYPAAKKYFKQTYAKIYLWFGDDDAKTWYYYARGTVAFIDDDIRALEKMIRTWERRFPTDKNYDALLNLHAHWGQDYSAIFQ